MCIKVRSFLSPDYFLAEVGVSDRPVPALQLVRFVGLVADPNAVHEDVAAWPRPMGQK